jgi:hypothetical protein
MDTTCFEVMEKLNLPGIIPIRVEDLITAEIEEVRKRTTSGQFCWVCQPLICEFILDKFNVDLITYLEADSMFFSNPEILFEELADNSVSLVPHNYSLGYDQTTVSGKFCVQFNVFRNNTEARKVLNYWRLRCFEYSKENLLCFPGQTCLDYWPIFFKSIKIINHPGAGVAVWNIQHRKFTIENGALEIDRCRVVFYHYHQYRIYSNGYNDFSIYPLKKSTILTVYRLYVEQIYFARKMVHEKFPEFAAQVIVKKMIVSLNDLFTSFNLDNLIQYARNFKRKLYNIHNIYHDNYFE